MTKQERAELRMQSQMPVVTVRLLDALDAKDALIAELLQLCDDAIANRVDIGTAYTVFDLLKARAAQ